MDITIAKQLSEASFMNKPASWHHDHISMLKTKPASQARDASIARHQAAIKAQKRTAMKEEVEMDEGWKSTAANLAISASLLGGVAAHDHIRGADYAKKQTAGMETNIAAKKSEIIKNNTAVLKAKQKAAELK